MTMDILVAPKFTKEAKKNKINDRETIRDIFHALKDRNIRNFIDHPAISKVKGTDPDVYVMKLKNLRIFFTKKNNSVVIMSVAKR